MPGISMCHNDTCKSRMKCFRYTAIPNDWQSYTPFGTDECKTCDFFYDNRGTHINPKFKGDKYKGG
jgi:hypothetical protein